MITGDQTAVIEFLSAPSTHGGAPVDRVETHASVVFLVGDRAYKLKRTVRFDYLDFFDARAAPADVRGGSPPQPANRAGALSRCRAGRAPDRWQSCVWRRRHAG